MEKLNYTFNTYLLKRSAYKEKKNYIMANKKAMICALKALIQNVRMEFEIYTYNVPNDFFFVIGMW